MFVLGPRDYTLAIPGPGTVVEFGIVRNRSLGVLSHYEACRRWSEGGGSEPCRQGVGKMVVGVGGFRFWVRNHVAG